MRNHRMHRWMHEIVRGARILNYLILFLNEARVNCLPMGEPSILHHIPASPLERMRASVPNHVSRVPHSCVVSSRMSGLATALGSSRSERIPQGW